MSTQSTGVIGGGIVGLAVARELARRRPGARVVVLEKEDRLASHQTGHSSGVVHAGIYYQPGSLKARLCTRGRELLRDYCAEHAIAYEEYGKLVVAVDSSELGRFDALEATARRNGVPGLRRVDGDGIREIEPHAVGLAALHSPRTAITDYVAVAEAMGKDIRASGGEILLGARVTGVERRGGRIDVVCGETRHRVDRLVICAGLQADRVARLAADAGGPRIIPFRGEYLSVRPAKQGLVRGLVYPVPDPRYPFLGVHFTRRVTGGLDVGPNAVLGLEREGYRRFDLDPADLRDIVGWPGFWRLARSHWRTGAKEVLGSLSVRAAMRSAQRYVPEIGPGDVVRGSVGVRAQAVERDGSLVDDFRISHGDGVTCVRNAPSPAATSSLAIAEHVADEVDRNG
ncbi:hydroxyglutarate oxidase [Intrasporangium oryzae NRRL B-24470]|uniref:Hydroxyglutarate oxidase n=1 Tax=Intrasporangium oryzae NRRL B-24470 TaxID=1386089 RepID=W9G947_9MICO|nr:L-2-hydroxyglutarate oxidase [Intrasporangium oryzae]EWT02716.1 hydroxyglutarate oxidase [Intrasporangium oryzae NRRL B-24470]